MKAKLFVLFLFLAGTGMAQHNTWVQKSNYGGGYRNGAKGFAIGSKGYILTGGSNSVVTSDMWEYDTLTNIWSAKASFPGNPREAAVAFSIGNKGYIGTGMDWTGTLFNDFWEYNSQNNTWTKKADFPGSYRYCAVGFSIGNKGYIGTGADSSGKENDLWEYDTLANTWTQKTSLPGPARYGAVGFSIGNKGYIGGGSINTGLTSDFWEFNPGTNSWVQKADIIVPNLYYACGFSVGSYGYINSDAGSNFGEYDPATNKWVTVASLGQPRNLAVAFSIGNKGYIGTGNDGSGRRRDFWMYTPCTYFPTATITANGPTTFCAGDSVILTSNSGLSYAWWNSTATTQSITVKTSGTYAVILTDSCGVLTSDPLVITVNPKPPVPTITQFDSLLTSSAPAYNQWYYNGAIIPGATGQTYEATLLGNYSVLVTFPAGCSNSSAPYNYTGNPNSFPSICLVTVDSSSQYNIVVWDKTLSIGVDTFVVLREISTNNYQPIAVIPYDSISQFVDTVRNLYFPNTGDPNTGTYRYKLQSIDVFGVHSPMSPYHNTIYFVNNGGIFTWLQSYEIENGANPVASYVLMRDDSSNGNWHAIGSVAGTQNFITDPQYSTYLPTASWRVKTLWSITCNPSKGAYSTSFSNTYKYLAVNANEIASENTVSIYPNPTTGKFVVQCSKYKVKSLAIYNLQGQQMMSAQFNNQTTNEMDVSSLAKGIYLVKVQGENGVVNKKLVIQ
jgi:hypothetical protein